MKKFVPWKFLCMLGLGLFLTNQQELKAQGTTVPALTATNLQTQLDLLVSVYNLKGVSASVIIPGQGTWNGVSGISHAGVPINASMGFRLGSITKNFTATGILLLQQDGLLRVTDSLHEYLPTYPNINPNVTIRQLLQHTSGIANYTNNPNFWTAVNNNPTQAMTPQFVLSSFVGTPPFPPGGTHYYSNTNYLLLRQIIETVSGQPYATFIRQRLLNPLQLTSFYVAELEPAVGVMPHNWVVANPWDPGVDISSQPVTAMVASSAGDNALVGNAADLARWAQLLFTGPVLYPISRVQMTQFFPFSGGNISGYGMGLMRYAMGNAQAWGHGGQISGFSTSFMYSPADGIVVSVLSNKETNGDDLAWAMLAAARRQLVNGTAAQESKSPNALVCYPNPAQGQGHVTYHLPKAQAVEITLQNSLGQTVKTLIQENQTAGDHTLTFDTNTLPAGLYFCTLQTGNNKQVQRWVLTN